jgi:hypothetical protein
LSALLAVLAVASIDRTSHAVEVLHEHSYDEWHGRAVELQQVEQAAKTCGVRNANLGIMHGAMFYRAPEDAGAELMLPRAQLTASAQRCIAQRSVVWRRVRKGASETSK